MMSLKQPYAAARQIFRFLTEGIPEVGLEIRYINHRWFVSLRANAHHPDSPSFVKS